MQIERAGLSLELDCPDGLPDICADSPRLEQVLVNLIHNAVKFTSPGGNIKIFARQEGDMVCFAVRDTGVGISRDMLLRVFERFYKTDEARSSGGTGLGLSISRHLVEAHSGRIWAESKLGEGSTFYFTIPTVG
jgi:two-component system phosphate regulon sensor histidine kinase PhoR